jgi:hypothetical protein
MLEITSLERLQPRQRPGPCAQGRSVGARYILSIHGSKSVGSAKASIALGCLVVVLGSWLASAQAQTYVSLGYGGVSCTTWSTRKAIEGKAYEAWMLGFISSYNAYVFNGPNVVEGADADDLRKWVDGYCTEHPQENFDAVVRLLIDEHAKRNSN